MTNTSSFVTAATEILMAKKRYGESLIQNHRKQIDMCLRKQTISKFHFRTRFCEIDLPDATLKFLDENFSSNDVIQLPVDLARYFVMFHLSWTNFLLLSGCPYMTSLT